MTSRTRVAVSVSVVVVLGLVWFLTRSTGPSPAEPDPPRPTPDVKVELPPPTREAVRGPSTPPPVLPEGPRPLEARALDAVAEHAGEGVVDCLLPADAPDGLPRGFAHAERHGRVLTARVETAEGRMVLQPPLPPQPKGGDREDFRAYFEVVKSAFGTAWWTDAHPGERGSCWVEPVQTVELVGHVEGDGPFEGSVNGCGSAGTVAEDGTFAFEVRVGAPCVLQYNQAGMSGGAQVDPVNPPADIAVPLPLDQTMEERLDQLREEIEYLQDAPDPIALALEAEKDEAVKALLAEQLEEARAERQERIDSLVFQADFFEKAADKEED